MATKGVFQLTNLTIRYCQHGGSSRYVRQMLKDERFLKFVEENPQIEFKTEVKGARHPIIIGDYLKNQQKVCDVKNKEIDDVLKHMTRMRNTSGRKMTKLKTPVVSTRPTIQGVWQPDLKMPDFTIKHVA